MRFVEDALKIAKNSSVRFENISQWELYVRSVLQSMGYNNPNVNALVETRQLDYRILAIESHPDDIALAAGGTLSLMKELGCEIRCVTMSLCDDIELARKRIQATITEGTILGHSPYVGITPAKELLNLVGGLDSKSDSALEELYEKHRVSPDTRLLDGYALNMQKAVYAHLTEFKPDLVLAPSPTDNTADHVAVSSAVRDAYRRPVNSWEYVGPEGMSQFLPNQLVPISTKHFARKMFALQQHQDAYYVGRPAQDGRRSYFNFTEQFVKALHYGRQAMPDARYDAPLAEAFKIRQSIGLPMIKRVVALKTHGR